MMYFGDYGLSAPIATPMVFKQLHSPVLVLDDDYKHKISIIL